MSIEALPDPSQEQSEDREFAHSAERCKVCQCRARSLIEDLIKQGIAQKTIVRWCNHHKLFGGKGLNEMNLSTHRRRHMTAELEASDSSPDERQALSTLLGMEDPERLDLVIAKGLVSVLRGKRKPDVKDVIQAIRVKSQIPRELAEADRARALVAKWKKKEKVDTAEEVEHEPVDTGIDGVEPVKEDVESGSEWYRKQKR